MEKCPKCGDEVAPLKFHAHRVKCDGKSSVPKEARPGKVRSTSSAKASGDVFMRRSESDVFNTASTRRGAAPKSKT
jgi:hypothetical protein